MLEHKLIKNYLQINIFSSLVLVEQEESPYALQKKATKRAAISGKSDSWLDAARLNSWDVNINFYQAFFMWWRPAFFMWQRSVFPI